jgi:hypothetical protein
VDPLFRSLCCGSLDFLCLDVIFIRWCVCLKAQNPSLCSVFLKLSGIVGNIPDAVWVPGGMSGVFREYYRRGLGGGRHVGSVVGNITDALGGWAACREGCRA